MSNFVWADLSTYHPVESRAFYEKVFGWQFYNDQGYSVAMQGTTEIVGLYETPDFFKKIKMPHFWMSYIEVDDALQTAEIARGFDHAKVELTDDFYGGKIALIRDPQGAGFTVYDGGKLNGRHFKNGCLIWNELHVSDATNVIPFYESLFGWQINAGSLSGQYNVFNSKQEHITDIAVIPNEIKGKYEYWVCTFAVEDLAQVKQSIMQLGGGVVLDEGERILVYDNSGEAFFYIRSIN